MVPTDDWRRLTIKREGVCLECQDPLPAGVTAEWSRSRRSVRCLTHGSPPGAASATEVPPTATPTDDEDQHPGALSPPPPAPAPVAPRAALAFFEAEWPLLFPPDKINEVRLEGPRSTRDLIRRPGPLPAGQVAAIAAHLRSAFPDASPSQP